MQLELDNMFIPQNQKDLADLCKRIAFKGIRILEIGSWKGNSTSVMASVLKDYEPSIYCVDTWNGSEGETEMLDEAKKRSIFSIFKNNLEQLGLYGFIKPLMMDSREAYKLLPDEYFDLIFVDGNHTYDFSYSDIVNYLPKLKKRGTICGDDCEDYFTSLPGEIVEQNKNTDWTVINGTGYHCGVITALFDVFNDEYEHGKNGSTFWWKEIEDPSNIYTPAGKMLVFGYQVKENESLLRSEAERGIQIIALDIAAASKLKELRINHIIFDQVVSEKGLAEIYEKSNTLSFSWYHIINDYVTYKNINLAELDFEAMRWYWFQAASILKLCSSEAGEIGLIADPAAGHSLYYYKNDSLRFLLEKCGKLRLLNQVQPKQKPGYIPSSNNLDFSSYAAIKDKYVFILHPGELYRYFYLIEMLFNHYGNNFVIIMLFPDKKIEQEIKSKIPVEVFDFFSSRSQNNNLFDTALLKLSNNSNNPVIKDVIAAGDQLNYLFEERWPVLTGMIDSWEAILNYKPKAVIGSSLPDAESQIPMMLCSNLKIPAISIPHGINTYKPFYNNNNISFFFSFVNEIDSYLKEGYDRNNLYLVNELELKYEYQTKKISRHFTGKNKILVLLYPAGIEGMLFRYSDVVKQVQAIEGLVELSKNDSSYDVKFKLHPGFHDKEIFDLIYEDEDLSRFILPLDSDLYDCLNEADLVISLNSINAAAVHSIRMKKPVIFYWNNMLYTSREKTVGAYDIFSSMYIAESSGDINKSIHYFFNDKHFASKLNSLSHEMCSYLESRGNRISFIDAVEQAINGGKAKSYNNGLSLKNTCELKVSVIVPTFNRSASLINLINSIYDLYENVIPMFEVIVVDNGSTDQTREMCEKYLNKYSNFKYVLEPEPGLLSGRHAGAEAACGDILTFVDDDIEVTETWLNGIIEAFNNPEVGLAGGPSIPIYESNYPDWMLFYFKDFDPYKECGHLSLQNMEGGNQFINPINIWGLNFSIRKKVLYEVGGFNPDTVNRTYQYLQGDGETGLSYKLMDNNYKALFSQNIKVYHNVYNTRMSLNYFKERAFFQGVCDSYTKFRKCKDFNSIEFPKPFNKVIPPQFADYRENYLEVHRNYKYGFYYHQFALRKSEQLQDWVLRKDYWDYKLPRLSDKFHNEMLTLRENLHVLDEFVGEEVVYAG